LRTDQGGADDRQTFIGARDIYVVAVARKLAVIVPRVWPDGSEFRFCRG
jgi:hypothetical protein